MPKLCICKICTCGRHKCPHNPTGVPIVDGTCTFSEYAKEFKAHPIEMRKSYKPEQVHIVNNAPMDVNTTHRNDFIQHPLPEKVKLRTEKYVEPSEEMDFTTNYGKDYIEKSIEPIRLFQRIEPQKVLEKFEGEPTYVADYKEWKLPDREKIKTDQYVYHPPDMPFDATTNYQTEFSAKRVEPTRIVRPTEQPKDNKPFEGDTHYRQDYVMHPIEPKEIKEKEVWKPSSLPLDDLTNYKKDFITKAVDKSLSCKPIAVPYLSNAPFVGDTTQKADYVQWPSEKREVRDKEIYKKPEGHFDMNTTTRTDYISFPLEKQSIIKPVEVRRMTGKFDDTTNYKNDFRQWTPTFERHSKPEEVYVPNSAPFDGLATYQLDYIRYPFAQPSKSVKPLAEQILYQGPMQKDTEYKKEFYRKEVAPCPVVLIEAGTTNKYRFSNCDEEGHKWFELLKSPMANGK